jgi:TolB-like protein
MRRTALVALLLALPAAALAKRPGLAVMDVRNVQGVQAGTATLITDVILTEVSGTRKFDVVGSADISSLLGLEKQKQLLQCGEDSSCLAELGGALGVDYLLSGTVGLLGTRLRISLTIQNVKKARVVARQARFCDPNEDALVKATEETVRAVLGELEANGALVARPSEPGVKAPPTRTEPAPSPKPLDLTPTPPPTPVGVAEPPPPPGEPATGGAGLSRKGWAWVIGGAGAALVAIGGGFDYASYASYQDQKDAVKVQDQAAFDAARSKGKTQATVANVLYGTGLAAMGAGAWLYFTAPSGPQVAVVPTEGGALLSLGGVLP